MKEKEEVSAKKDTAVIITNRQMEGMLKAIPSNWTIAFKRPLLRPDILEITIRRPDGLAFSAKTTGAMLLEKPDGDFMASIQNFVQQLKIAKAKKN
jgi:hypothetical protein